MPRDDLARKIQAYVEIGLESRNAAESAAAAARAWPTRLPDVRLAVVATIVVVAAISGALVLDQQAGTGTTVQVGELAYDVSVARSLRVIPGELRPYGTVEAYTDSGAYPLTDVAYALHNVDPEEALVVRWATDLSDDAGPLGEYALLLRGLPWEIDGLCQFFDPREAATPAECR